MKVIAICAFPVEAAATRFRLAQFVEPLNGLGIEMDIRPFLTSRQFAELYSAGGGRSKAFSLVRSILDRIFEIGNIRKYDLIVIQREAMIFGPAVFERLYQLVGRIPMVLDLDDATYVPYVSPSYGRLGSALKFFGKTDKLIERADAVICGNRFIAEYVEAKGTRAVVIPTIVDTDQFCPAESGNETPVIGWVGTHSTYPFLEKLFPVLERLARSHRFTLKLVGAGRVDINVPGVDIETLEWSISREIADFQSIDIGLYPIFPAGAASDEWIKGKSGFKAIQYMAVGVGFVMSPVGVCAEIGEPGKTHVNAVTDEDWYNSLATLLADPDFRKQMGERGRLHSVKHYAVPMHAEKLARVLQNICGLRRTD